MRTWLPAMALGVVLTLSGSPSTFAMGAMGGGSAAGAAHASGGFGGRGFVFHRGPDFHHRFLSPRHLFHEPRFDFGAGFVSHRLSEVAGGYGDYDYASEDDYGPYVDDDIDNLHFRVQEPFGPGDIGRPPVRAEEDAPYVSERMDPWHGYGPQDW